MADFITLTLTATEDQDILSGTRMRFPIGGIAYRAAKLGSEIGQGAYAVVFCAGFSFGVSESVKEIKDAIAKSGAGA